MIYEIIIGSGLIAAILGQIIGFYFARKNLIFQFQKQRAVDFFLDKILAFQSTLQTTKEIRDMILSPKKKRNDGFYP